MDVHFDSTFLGAALSDSGPPTILPSLLASSDPELWAHLRAFPSLSEAEARLLVLAFVLRQANLKNAGFIA